MSSSHHFLFFVANDVISKGHTTTGTKQKRCRLAIGPARNEAEQIEEQVMEQEGERVEADRERCVQMEEEEEEAGEVEEEEEQVEEVKERKEREEEKEAAAGVEEEEEVREAEENKEAGSLEEEQIETKSSKKPSKVPPNPSVPYYYAGTPGTSWKQIPWDQPLHLKHHAVVLPISSFFIESEMMQLRAEYCRVPFQQEFQKVFGVFRPINHRCFFAADADVEGNVSHYGKKNEGLVSKNGRLRLGGGSRF